MKNCAKTILLKNLEQRRKQLHMCVCVPHFRKRVLEKKLQKQARVGGCAAAAVISLDAFCKPLQSFAHQEEHCNEANCIK